MDYKARFYSPALMRFIQPDTIIPDQSNPQSWNRYSYVINNPIRYVDPSGHCFTGFVLDTLVCLDVVILVVAVTVVAEATIYYTNETPQGRRLRDQATSSILGAFEHGYDRLKQQIHDYEQMLYDMEHYALNLKKGCLENKLLCAVFVALAGLIVIKAAQRACDEDEAANCPSPIPNPTPAVPTITPSVTPACPPLSNCGASSPTVQPLILPGTQVNPPVTPTTPTPPAQAPLSPTQTSPSRPNRLTPHTPI